MSKVVVRTVSVKTKNKVIFSFDLTNPSNDTKIDDVKKLMLSKTSLDKEDIDLYHVSFYSKRTKPLPNMRLNELAKAKHLTLWCNIIKVKYRFGSASSTLYSFIDDKVMDDVEEFLFIKHIKVPSGKKTKAACNSKVFKPSDTFLSCGLDSEITINAELEDTK